MTANARMALTCFMAVILVRGGDLRELPLDPIQLAGDIFDDVARFEVSREHVPRIGFDLEMRRERCLLVDGERLLQRKARRAEGTAEVVEEHRHVEVRPPFPRPRIRGGRLEGILEIEE